MRFAVILALAVVLPAQAKAQAVADSPAPRSVTVAAGIGYLPEFDPGDASGVAFAGGLRTFTSGTRHRGFVEFSVSQVAYEIACFEQCRTYYGPGVQAGYQFVSRRGFTVLASFGVAYAPSIPDGDEKVGGLGGLGIGYTWRR